MSTLISTNFLDNDFNKNLSKAKKPPINENLDSKDETLTKKQQLTHNNQQKVIKREFNSNKMNRNKLESILKEVIIICRIMGENLFQTINKYHIENKKLIIEMNHYDQTLNHYFIENENMLQDMKTKLIWLKDLAFSLDYLHFHLQTHKNINKHNVFVVENNRLILGQCGFTSELLEMNTNLEYYPIEFNKNKQDYDLKSDIFSLGCLFYEILTNKKAFESEKEILESKSVEKILNTGNVKLDEMIYKMLDHDRNKRPTSGHIMKFLISISSN